MVHDYAQRTDYKPPRLVTTDDCATYEPALLECYGQPTEVVRRKDGQADRRFRPVKVWPDGSVYATVKKTFKQGEVAEARQTLALGTPEQLRQALSASPASEKVNTSFMERQNATDRLHNSRKARKTLCFSKDLVLHLSVSWWVMFCYNFHFPNAGLRQVIGFDEKRQRRVLEHRTPAMTMGLATHPLSISEIVLIQLPHRPSHSTVTARYFMPWKTPSKLSARTGTSLALAL